MQELKENLKQEMNHLIARALEEDKAREDITSRLLITSQAATLLVYARGKMVTAGANPICQNADTWNKQMNTKTKMKFKPLIKDGTTILKNTPILKVQGMSHDLLAIERSLLNLLHIACAIATTTANYKKALEGSNIILLDTRKTIPAMRHLCKYASRMGGAHNHRMNLKEQILIKDNHIDSCGGMEQTLQKLSPKDRNNAIIECETKQQAQTALSHGASWLMLDNMSMVDIIAISKQKGKAKIEVSGGITMQQLEQIKSYDIDFVSIGRPTIFPHPIDITAEWIKS